MFVAWIVFHVLVCVALVLVVLMQSSKGEGLAGSAFGGGGGGLSGAVFGGRGAASFLSRATTVLAVLFMLNCVALAYMSASGSGAAVSSSASPENAGTSVVTQKAQQERDDAMRQQQQQQQQVVGDTAAAGDVNLDDLLGGDQPTGSDSN